MLHQENIKKFVGLSVILLALISVVYYYYHLIVAISSDTTTMIPVVYDILKGNWLMKYWYFGSNNFFFTDTIFYLIGTALGASSQFLINYLPGLFYLVLVWGLLVFFWYRPLHEKAKSSLIFCLASTLGFLLVVPYSGAYTLLNANSHNNLYLFVLIGIICSYKFAEEGRKSYLAGYCIIGILSYYSDSLTLLILFAPILIYAGYSIIKKEQRKRYLILGLATISALAVGKLMLMLQVFLGGSVTRGLPLELVSVLDWPGRLYDFGYAFLALIGYTRLSDLSVGGAISNVFIALHLVLMVTMFVYNTFRVLRFRLEKKELLLYLISIVNVAGCVVTNVTVHNRYMAPFYIFGTVMVYLSFYNLLERSGLRRLRILTGLGIVGFFYLSCYRIQEIARVPLRGEGEREVVYSLEQSGWGDGYGEFWAASVCSFYSDFEVGIYPIIFSEEKGLEPYPELIDERWYDEKDKHFVIMENTRPGIEEHKRILTRVLGDPQSVSYLGGIYEVWYWEADISEMLYKTD